MAEETTIPIPKQRRVSLIWKYFNKIANRRDKVHCSICDLELNFCGTTGNLLRHLNKKHKIEINQSIPTKENEHYALESNNENYIDPYDKIKLPIEEYIQLDEINYRSDAMTPDEERITAEIEYFREKAAYYRMQKNLVALQAAKFKKELQ